MLFSPKLLLFPKLGGVMRHIRQVIFEEHDVRKKTADDKSNTAQFSRMYIGIGNRKNAVYPHFSFYVNFF